MEKEVNCVNCKAIIEYVRAHNNGECSRLIAGIHPEIDSLKNPIAYLTDTKNWVSTSVIIKLFERVRSLFQNDHIAYEIARFVVENPSLEKRHLQFVKSFWSYKSALNNLQKINDLWNRNKKAELLEIKRNHAVVRLHWAPDVNTSKDLCIFNQGHYTFLPMIWGGKPLSLKEKCCYFDGAPYCEYHLKYPFLNRFHEVFSRFFTRKNTLMEIIEEMEEEKKIVEEQYEKVHRLNLELNRKMKQLLAAQDTAKAILSVLELEPLLTDILNILSDVCRMRRAIIMLVNDREGCLEYMHAIGFDGDVPDIIKNYKVDLNRVSNILVRVTNTGRSEYIPRVEESSLKRDNILLTHGKPSSVYVVPLITRSKVIGIIATDAVDDKGVPEETRETMEIFAPQIAIAIENARYYQRLEKQMADLEKSYALLGRAEKFSFLGNLAARLANEIKDPLATISRFIRMLPHKFDDEEFRDHFYNIALEETKRVNDLISELLSMVRTKKSQFEFDDLHNLIDRMILLISPQSNAKHIKVYRKFDPDIEQVWMDAEKMKQVILNILSNAVEFTPENGKIECITTHITENEGMDRVQIEIRDTGTGIAESYIDKIFDPYFTTKHASTLQNGTGLGLFIAHQNVLDHKGEIEVKSNAKEGTTCIITLPLNYGK
jgi:signal transduction histidine kinase